VDSSTWVDGVKRDPASRTGTSDPQFNGFLTCIAIVADTTMVEFSDLDDALASARAGDEWGITCLFRALHPQLVRYLRHHAPDVAEDLASETWLAAAKGLANFEGDAGDFRAWMFTIARRRVADHYRSKARRPRFVSLDATVDLPAVGLAGDAGDVALDAMSAQDAIKALVSDLPAEQAEVVLLRVVAGLSVSEVAGIIGRSPGAVRMLQHRALQHLRKLGRRGSVTL
jgi:RNA polymerase sigma-70 factor (ECF subfamily)